MSAPLHLAFLGGLGEIGMNCMVVESERAAILIDCGVCFDDRPFGVDVVRPRFEHLRSLGEKLRALVLTHGHEDHIGAVPYLLRERGLGRLPIYGPRYALSLIEERLSDPAHEDITPPKMVTISPGERHRFDDLVVEPFRVTHSMPGCTGLILETPQGIVVHTGDFKIDPSPGVCEPFDLERLDALGQEGVRLLMSDSTNALSPGRAASEQEVREELYEAVASADRRVVVALFASNVHRLAALAEIARRTDRRLCLLGRSVEMHAKLGAKAGYLRGFFDRVVPREKAQSVAPRELLVVATGTQGEPPAALPRLARGEHPDLKLEEGDVVLMSSRMIPGNERPIFDLINLLLRRGVEVRTRASDPGLHASGHAHSEEQREILRRLRPSLFLPVHGTLRHLRRHAELAAEEGVARSLIVERGARVRLDEEGLSIASEVPAEPIAVQRGRDLAAGVLEERASLARVGVATLGLAVDRRGRLLDTPRLVCHGVWGEQEAEALGAEACRWVEREWSKEPRQRKGERGGTSELEATRERASRALRRFFRARLGVRPVVQVLLHRIEDD